MAADGTPRVRTLVFRGWASSTALDLLSDDRSARPAELSVDVPMPEHVRLLRIGLEQVELRNP